MKRVSKPDMQSDMQDTTISIHPLEILKLKKIYNKILGYKLSKISLGLIWHLFVEYVLKNDLYLISITFMQIMLICEIIIVYDIRGWYKAHQRVTGMPNEAQLRHLV